MSYRYTTIFTTYLLHNYQAVFTITGTLDSKLLHFKWLEINGNQNCHKCDKSTHTLVKRRGSIVRRKWDPTHFCTTPDTLTNGVNIV